MTELERATTTLREAAEALGSDEIREAVRRAGAALEQAFADLARAAEWAGRAMAEMLAGLRAVPCPDCHEPWFDGGHWEVGWGAWLVWWRWCPRLMKLTPEWEGGT